MIIIYRSNMSNQWRKPVLSQEQMEFFEDKGYVIIPNVIDQETREQLISEMYKFANINPKAPNWQSVSTTLNKNGFLEMYHHPLQWKIRQDPLIYNIFADIFQQNDLWVSIDRVCMKPPGKGRFDSSGFTHWDFDPWGIEDGQKLQLQGVIALEDTDVKMGGFHCVPGMHKWIKGWTDTHPVSQGCRDKFIHGGMPIRIPKRFKTQLTKNDTPIPMKAGDILIWRGELAHGNALNTTDRVRLAMYLTMFPADESQQEWIGANINTWALKLPGCQSPYPQLGFDGNSLISRAGDPRQIEQKSAGKTNELTELGEKLIGMSSWYE